MLRKKVFQGALGVAAVAALFAAITVQAQSSETGRQSTTGTTASGQSGTGTGTSGQSGTGAAGSSGATSGQSGNAQTGATSGSGQAGATASGSGSGSGSGSLNRSDKKMLMNLAQANMAEIEAGRLAQSKSQNEQVKNFAQQMIDDHTKALDDVKQLAQARGVTLPNDLDRTHKAKANRMQSLSGEAFDRAYLAQAGVADHKKNHTMLQSAQSHAKDPELKALVARTLPVVDQHLSTVQQLHNTAHGSSKTQGSTGSSPDKK